MPFPQALLENVKLEHKSALARLQAQYDAERQARMEITSDRDFVEGKLNEATKARLRYSA